tara:strand:- start:190 stop:627 length:438 start_codon:yes stop_codon:yes gene_type:complete
MSQNIASFLKRVGALIPGFQGYESSEELRESDYQIRLYTKEALENYIYLIERAKGELDDKELMNLDKIQNQLKLFSAKIVNQKFGYSALFERKNNDTKLSEVIENDVALISAIESIDTTCIDPSYIQELCIELEMILAARKKILR